MGSSCRPMSADDTESVLPRRNTSFNLSSPRTLNSFSLTSQETQIITETWQSITDKNEFAVRLFARIFELNPVVQTIFGFDEFKDKNQLISSTKFIGHANNFASFLHMIIGHVKGNESVAFKVCKVIGREHVRLTRHQQFETKHWHTFIDALLIEMEIDQKKSTSSKNRKYVESVNAAWRELLEKVVEVMEAAYNEAKSQE